MTDYEQLLRNAGDGIHGRGNSHNPEFWVVGNRLHEIADRCETSEHSALLTWCEDQLADADDSVEEDIYETAIAILEDNTNGGACLACAELRGLDTDGYCWYCVHLYDRKP